MRGARPWSARLMQAGETVGSTARRRCACASATRAATRLVFRGQPTELAAFTRDNVARLDLK